jgi:SAM-dependent methyltransferase
MLSNLIVRASTQDPQIGYLAERLAAFYYGNQKYYLSAEGEKDAIYQPLCDVIQTKFAAQGRISVLELGAGRTRFPQYAAKHGLGNRLSFTAHDIDETNVAYYESEGIQHAVGPVIDLIGRGRFDVAFSTFVLEHVPDPQGFLDASAKLIEHGGLMVIVCPKYDYPFYVPPALRWLRRWQQVFVNLRLVMQNALVHVTRRPNFWICIEPAVFHRPWRRDYDAVHLVTEADIRTYLRPNFRVRRLQLVRANWRQAILDRLILLSLVAERRS